MKKVFKKSFGAGENANFVYFLLYKKRMHSYSLNVKFAYEYEQWVNEGINECMNEWMNDDES